jgi:hypothetical protein
MVAGRAIDALKERDATSMPTKKFTQNYVNQLKLPANGAITYWDAQLPGFGCRVSARGRRTWVASYRVSGRSVLETLGTSAIIPKVATARDLARASMLKARQGVHPVKERKAHEAAQQAEAEASKKTFSWLVEHEEGGVAKGFIPQFAAQRQRPSSLASTKYMLNRVMPHLGHKLLVDIKRADIVEVLDNVASKRLRPYRGHTGPANTMARCIQTCLATVFNWAYREDLIEANPMKKVAFDRHGRATARDRALEDDEIAALWATTETLGWPFGPIAKLLLLTGQRAGQVAGMRWSELNLEEALWTLPSARTKNKLTHLVPLSAAAIAIIEQLPASMATSSSR